MNGNFGARKISFEDVIEAIKKERAHQEAKWGKDDPQSCAGFLLIIQAELNEAIAGWMKNLPGKSACMNELVQVAATAIAALERYGTTGTPFSTNDIPNLQGSHYESQ